MKKLFTFLFSLVLTLGIISAVNAAPRHSIDFSGKKIISLAVIPYINNSNDMSDYIRDSLSNEYTNYFANSGFKVISKESTEEELNNAGYIIADNVIAPENVLKSVAEYTHSDFVIAMEVEEISTSRDDEFPKTKLTAKVKLLYEIYKKSEDRTYRFRIATTKDNKATLAEVGPKYAIKTALDQALERGNHRLIEIINGNKTL